MPKIPQILTRLAALAAALLAIAPGSAVLWGQTQPYGPTVGGLAPVVPVVPQRPPRPLEGAHGQDQFNRFPNQAPTGSFIDTLKGNDAAFEVFVGQGKLLTIRRAADIAQEDGTAVVAVGDPTILEFQILPNPRLIRLIGLRAGVTDLSITTPDGETFTYEIHVVYDLTLLRAQLKQIFPDATLRLAQLREHVVVEGQARSTAQVARIIETLQAYLESVQVPRQIEGAQPAGGASPYGPVAPPAPAPPPTAADPGFPVAPDPTAYPEVGGPRRAQATFRAPQIINLIRVPGVQQVLLKVRIAELNRTAFRRIGADILAVNQRNGNIIGTQIGGAGVSGGGLATAGGLTGSVEALIGSTTTAFGIFPSSDFQILLSALRDNALLSILAEPNLIALNGHQASFLAGGEFPIPVPQGGVSNQVTIQFREFGVRLNFLPYILDEETIRLTVTPEVSSIDFTLGTTLVVGGTPVPGLNTRRTETTVELRQTETLAIAGLLRADMEATTTRIPGLGDLPYIGPFFSNTTHNQVEKELLVLVTPYLVQPLAHHEVGPLPGQEIKPPNDPEFYLMNRIEGRTDSTYRPTTDYELYHRPQLYEYDRQYMRGPVGHSAPPPAIYGPQGFSK